MTSPSAICTSCLRTVQRAAARTQPGPRSLVTNSTRAYRAAPATPQQSLYLDFLAPSSRRGPSASLDATRKAPVALPRYHCRTLSTATATAESAAGAQQPPQHVARAILHPRTDEKGNPLLISIAPRAAHRLSKIAADDKNPDTALRVTIESGGCHGFQYLMDLVDLSKKPAAEDDTVFEGDKGAKVVIDEASLELLAGSTVDYTMELIGSQFKITGIPGATSSCGCGTSFDIKI